MSKLSDFSATRLLGGSEPLSDFEGKVTLVVNVASHCGNTPQYAELERLYEDYGPKGLVIPVSYTHLTLPTNREV